MCWAVSRDFAAYWCRISGIDATRKPMNVSYQIFFSKGIPVVFDDGSNRIDGCNRISVPSWAIPIKLQLMLFRLKLNDIISGRKTIHLYGV
jgi:hypothetical protein